MKKLLVVMIAALMAISYSKGQSVNYIFSQSATTYAEITGGTLLGDESNDDVRFVNSTVWTGGSNTTGDGYPLGFDFVFDGKVFDRLAVNANGWISLGQSSLNPAVDISSSSDYVPLGSTKTVTSPALISRIVALSDDLEGQAGSSLRLETVGSAPNRECVIQWKHYRKRGEADESYNFQIRLCETTNEVKIVFGSFTVNQTFKLVQTGLRGAPVSPASNYHLRTTMSNWSATTSGTLAQLYCMLSSVVKPTSGLTFIYTYVPDAPAAFSAVSAGPDQVYLSWTKNSGNNDVLIAGGSSPINGSPVAGESYSVGSQLPGGGTVIYTGGAADFMHTGLASLTEYHYAAWSVSGGSTYSNAVRDSAYTSGGIEFTEDFDESTSLPAGWTGDFTVLPGHGTLETHGLSFRMNSNGQANADVPQAGPYASPTLAFHYRLANHEGYPASGSLPGAGDKLEVQVSTDNGANYTTVHTINQGNHIPSVAFRDMKIDLGGYGFTSFMVRFLVTSTGTGDYYLDIDNVSIGDNQSMVVAASNVIQADTSLIFSGSSDKAILCLRVLTRNSTLPLTLASIQFNTAGSTDPGADIGTAKAFHSILPYFQTAIPAGNAVSGPQGDFVINPGALLSEGENYFWLVYDVKANATDRHIADATCAGFTISGSPGSIVPFVTDPGGGRKIREPRGDFYIPGDFSSVFNAVENLNGIQSVGNGGINFMVAAGHTETLPDYQGILIRFTGTEANPVSFMKSGTGNNPLITAGKGFSNSTDGIIIIAGGDHITFDGIDLLDPVSNDDPQLQMEWGYALLKKQSVAPVNGCQHVTIKNCRITLQKINPKSTGIYTANHVPGNISQLVLASADDAMNHCKFYGNNISNVYSGIKLTGYNAPSPYTLYDTGNEIGVSGSNTVSDFGGSDSDAYGIYTQYQADVRVAFNAVNGGTGTTGYLWGIWVHSERPANVDIIGNSVNLAASVTKNSVTAILNGCSPCFDTPSGTGTVNIRDNMVSGCSVPNATSGIFSGIRNRERASEVNVSGNMVSNNHHAGTGGFYGIEIFRGGTVTVYNNTISGNRKTGAAGWMYLLEAAGEACDIYANKIFDNRIPNSQASFGSCDITGINATNSTRVNVYDNEIYDLSVGGTTNSKDSDITGIFIPHVTVLNMEKNIYGNRIENLSAVSGVVCGILHGDGGLTRIHGNLIAGLSSSQAVDMEYEPPVTGILCHRGYRTYVYNNFISGLHAPLATVDDAVRGIAVTSDVYSEDTVGIYHNTIYLDAVSTGPNFGTSGIYQYSEIYQTDVPELDMRNNIVINNSVPNGTGKTVVFRRSMPGPLTSYSELSNSNIFYAGIPGPANLIYSDGTSEDQTIEAFKIRVAPRESNSSGEIPPFINISSSPYDLHIDSTFATGAKQGGTALTGFLKVQFDFDGDARNVNTPDIGADEFSAMVTPSGNKWLGTVSTEWRNPVNWSEGVPDSAGSVIIAKGSLPPVIEMTEKVQNLKVEEYGVLIIAPGGQLTVDNLFENSGTLLIKTYLGSSGSLIHHTRGINGSVECYIQGDQTTDSSFWHMISSPVEHQEIAQFVPAPGAGGHVFMGYDEPSNSWFTPGENPELTHFTPGEGYGVWWENTQIPVFRGILNVDDIIVPGLTQTPGKGEGWHSLGNPYPSSLKWNDGDLWNLNHIAGSALVWNAYYKSFTVLPKNGIIAPMQGFFVQALQDGASLTISSASRIHSSNYGIPGGNERIVLMARDPLDQSVQESVLQFNPAATDNFDPAFDAGFLAGGYAPEFYAVAGGERLMANTLPVMHEDVEVVYGFSAGGSGEYAIELLETIPGAGLFLNDLKTGTENHLTMQVPYTFSWNEGEDPLRFVLRFKSGVNGVGGPAIGGHLFARARQETLVIHTNAPETRIEVYDLLGREWYHENVGISGIFEVPVSLKSGFYVVRLTAGFNTKTFKVFVE